MNIRNSTIKTLKHDWELLLLCVWKDKCDWSWLDAHFYWHRKQPNLRETLRNQHVRSTYSSQSLESLNLSLTRDIPSKQRAVNRTAWWVTCSFWTTWTNHDNNIWRRRKTHKHRAVSVCYSETSPYSPIHTHQKTMQMITIRFKISVILIIQL